MVSLNHNSYVPQKIKEPEFFFEGQQWFFQPFCLSRKYLVSEYIQFIKSALYCLLARAVKSPFSYKVWKAKRDTEAQPYSIQTTPASRITAS